MKKQERCPSGQRSCFCYEARNLSIKNTDHHGIIKTYADRDGALDE